MLQLEAQISTCFNSQFPHVIDHSTLTLFVLVIGPAGCDSLEENLLKQNINICKL